MQEDLWVADRSSNSMRFDPGRWELWVVEGREGCGLSGGLAQTWSLGSK